MPDAAGVAGFESPSEGKFQVGEVYYKLWGEYHVRADKTVPTITMWIFDGFDERPCGAGRYNRGYRFKPFNNGWPEDWVDPVQSPITFPEDQLVVAEAQFLTWDELADAIIRRRAKARGASSTSSDES